MENLLIGVIAGLLILLASVASVELGISVALIEITFGVVAGNFLSLTSPPWMDFLASFGSILLTFGTISSLYGLNAGILDQAQFSVLVTVVVASAVIPTIIAQRWFHPAKAPRAARARPAGARR